MNNNRITRTDTVSTADLLVLFSATDTEYQGAPMDALLTYLNANLTLPKQKVPQAEAPLATGFAVVLQNKNAWLILTPSAAFAEGTIQLPQIPEDGREYLVTTTQAVTALTMDTQGANISGAPTSLTAGDFFTLRYYSVTNTWYRVG